MSKILDELMFGRAARVPSCESDTELELEKGDAQP